MQSLASMLQTLRRPFLIVCAICILSNPSAALRKLRLVYISLLYLAFCKDKKWKVPKEKDPASFFPKELGGSGSGANDKQYREKTILIIRHGESTWNDTFNAGDRNKLLFVLLFLPNLVYAIVAELYFFISGKDSESWFYDSALSAKGVSQAEGMRQFLKKEKMKLGSGSSGGSGTNREEHAIKLLLALGDEGGASSSVSSHVVSSNLRRAISTAAITLADRFALNHKDDEIILLPSLQEISFNPDALSILPPRGVVHPTWCDTNIAGLSSKKKSFASMVNTTYHTGNKTLDSNGLLRLQQFCADVFDDTKLPKSNIIAVGHSLFFRSFFRVYLPRGVEHIAKEKKLVNGGSVMVTLREVTIMDGEKKKLTKEYMIDPTSIVVVYGGFGKHTKG